MSLREALENPGEVKRRIEQHKRDMWGAIKAENPDIASFVEEVTGKFGKPERVIYEARGRVLDSEKPST